MRGTRTPNVWMRGSDVRCTFRGEVVACYVKGYITWRLFLRALKKKENVVGGLQQVGKTIHGQEGNRSRTTRT